MEHASNTILVLLSFFIPRKIALFIFKKTRFYKKILDVYAQKQSFFFIKNYSKYEKQIPAKTILVYRNKGQMIDAGTLNDYVNLIATGILNNFRIIFVSQKRDDKNYDEDIFNRFFDQIHYDNSMEEYSLDEISLKYKTISFGSYLSINKRKSFAYKRYLKFNKSTEKYFETELSEIVKGQKILGVFMRGTDYINLKPKNHPRVPNIQEVFENVDKIMKRNNYSKLYLGTEDLNIVDAFRTKYGNDVVLTNNTIYLNDNYEKNKWISNIVLGINDEYYQRSITYISSMNILAHCNALIACVAGGSSYAITINKKKYESLKLIKKGFNK